MHPLNDRVDRLIREVAAQVIMPRFQRLVTDQIVEKTPGELVTVADIEAEQRLAEGLSAIAPGVGIVGEEAVASDPRVLELLHHGDTWVIDPIDGTGNFALGRQPFGIMVALIRGGESVASWIYDPVLDRACHAASGMGAYIGGRRIYTRASTSRRPIASLATQFMAPDLRERVRLHAASVFDLEPIPRCAAEQYARLCLGRNDVGLFQRSLAWDHAAGSLLLSEAGGKVARWDGAPYRLTDGRSGLLAAATPDLWEAAATLLFCDQTGLDAIAAHPLAQSDSRWHA